jgi:hypothetical protein
MRRRAIYFFIFSAFIVGGCTTPPPLDPLNRVSIRTVVDHVNCEIQRAVKDKDVLRTKWYMKYDLTMQVDQNGSVSPSVTVIRPYHSTVGTLNLGAGFNFSGTATRIETITVKAKLANMKDANCDNESTSNVDIAGDLGIKDWLNNILTPRTVYGPTRGTQQVQFRATQSPRLTAPEVDSIGHTAQFILIAGANAAPTLLLEKFKGPSANGIFGSISRTDTNKIIIAFSNQDPNKGNGSASYDRTILNQQLQLQLNQQLQRQ